MTILYSFMFHKMYVECSLASVNLSCLSYSSIWKNFHSKKSVKIPTISLSVNFIEASEIMKATLGTKQFRGS